MQIMLIEDDGEAASYLVKGLTESGHRVELVEEGRAGLVAAREGRFDAMIIDRMLPGLDGLAIIAALRAAKDQTPVLILSALGDVENRVEGLRSGCDDYLSKPFVLSELLARLEAITRRSSVETKLRIADLEMDLLTQSVTRAGQSLDLLPREFKLLEYLMRHAGDIVTRAMLLENVWNYRFDPQTNVIDVHLSRLRQKIDKDFGPPLLQTVRGSGYRLGVGREAMPRVNL